MNLLRSLAIGQLLLVSSVALNAQTIWHCSKQSAVWVADQRAQKAMAPEDVFQIASINTHPSVIGITLRDLMDAYSGVPVRVSGQALTACVMREPQSTALESLGIGSGQAASLPQINREGPQPLQWVNTTDDMLSCMLNNHPSVGYFTEFIETPEVLPCF